jgi:hypothetical protein
MKIVLGGTIECMSNLPNAIPNEPNEEQKQWMKDHKFSSSKENTKNTKNDNGNGNEKKKKEEIVYKYSNKGKGELRESIILKDMPTFVQYAFIEESEKHFTKLAPVIEEQSRIIMPPHPEDYPYDPYEFRDLGEPQYYLNRALNHSIDSIYRDVKNMFTKFNDVNQNTISLLSAYTIGSYFQDRFSTIHYLMIVGDNGTGKSAIGDTFESLGYRAVSITDATPATWYRLLGSVEHGQVTIIADEADNIGESIEVMSILKTGYQPKGKVFRMDSDNRKQQFFYPYCMKIIIAEKSPGETKAKGLLDRSFKIKSYKGFPEYDIKEVRNPQGNKERQEQLDEINSLRKTLLMFKLIHFKDPLPEVDVGLDGRDKELCKPILQLFYGLGSSTETLKEIEIALQYFLDVKNERKKNSLEAVIHPIVTNAISEFGKVIDTRNLWISIVGSLDGEGDASKPSIFHSSEYGRMYRNTITKMICDKFGAEMIHKEKGNVLIFNDYIFRVGKLYSGKKTIQTRLKTDQPDAPDAPDAQSECESILNFTNQTKNNENHCKFAKKLDEFMDLDNKMDNNQIHKGESILRGESGESG